MAGGYRCKNCGWQQATHEGGGYEDEVDLYATKKRGYSKSLDECRNSTGFTPRKIDRRDERHEAKLAREAEERRLRYQMGCSYFD